MTPSAIRNVMFFGAHPDDETVMAGGTLAMLHVRGVATHLVCATDGRGGEYGDVPSANTPDALARVRRDELSCAAEALGLSSVTMLGYEDPLIGPGDELFGFDAQEDTFVEQLVALLREKAIDVVLSHGSDGEYGHPAHIQMHRAVRRAVQERVTEALFYGIAAHVPAVEDRLWNASDPAHFALDVTPWVEAKHAAMLCHRTQHLLFRRRRKLATVREAIRLVESFHRFWPPATEGEPLDDPFARLLLDSGAQRVGPAAAAQESDA